MSENLFNKRAKANEDEYFARKNQEAIERLAVAIKSKSRVSPISSKPMVGKVIQGLNVFECEDSKGLWVEKDELKNLLNDQSEFSWDQSFFTTLADIARKTKATGLRKVAEESEGLRLSPITLKPMTKIDVEGVILDFCEESGGVWFDVNELSQFTSSSHTSSPENLSSWVHLFYKSIGYK